MDETKRRDKIWLKFYDEGVPASIDYPKIPLDRLLRDAAAKHPEHPAAIFGGSLGSRVLDATLTYRQLDQAVDSFAAGLQRLGVRPGDRVAVQLPNSPQFVIAAFATWRIGAIMVCCNPLYVPREVEHLLSDSGSETMVVMSSLYERVKQVRDKTPLKRVIVTNIKEYLPGLLKLLFTVARERKEGHRVDISGDADTYWFQDVMGSAQAKPEAVTIDPMKTATLIYTGGTTGVPKGVQLSHYSLVSNAVTLCIWGDVQEARDIMVGVMPFFHAYGLAVGMLVPIARALTTIQAPNPRDLPYVLASIAKHKATIYPGVPAMFVAFNSHPDRSKYDLTSLRYATCAAAPLPPEVQERFEAITGGKLVEAYGMTETSPAVSADPVNSPRAHSIGVPLPDTELAIVDVETGEQEMPMGEAGEIIVKGPQVMLGYWERPTETANAIRTGPDGQPGWYFTGDIGFMDEDGYFHISDRKKDMIIAGGYNIYPAEVEAVLFEQPKVLEAAVIGVPDERRGETVKAFIVPKEGQQVTEEEIIAFCRERLAAYKVPRIIVFRDELPKTMVGKVLRRELRD
ncbi:MAG: long-chain fatty acid--CoA ligase [Chloroflexota bacterium]